MWRLRRGLKAINIFNFFFFLSLFCSVLVYFGFIFGFLCMVCFEDCMYVSICIIVSRCVVGVGSLLTVIYICIIIFTVFMFIFTLVFI